MTGTFGSGPSPAAKSTAATTSVLWAKLSPATSPLEHSCGAAANDPDVDQALMFGGQTCSGAYRRSPALSISRLAKGLPRGHPHRSSTRVRYVEADCDITDPGFKMTGTKDRGSIRVRCSDLAPHLSAKVTASASQLLTVLLATASSFAVLSALALRLQSAATSGALGEVYRPFAESEFAKCPSSERQENRQWAVFTELTSLVCGVRAKDRLFRRQSVVTAGATSRNLFKSTWNEICEAKWLRRLAS